MNATGLIVYLGVRRRWNLVCTMLKSTCTSQSIHSVAAAHNDSLSRMLIFSGEANGTKVPLVKGHATRTMQRIASSVQ